MTHGARLALALVLPFLAAGAVAAPAGPAPAAFDRSAAKLPPGFAGLEPEGFYWQLPDETRNPGEGDEAWAERTAQARAPYAGARAFSVHLRPGTPGEEEPCAWWARYEEARKRLVVSTNAVSGERVCLVYRTNAPPFQKARGKLAPGEKERKDKAVELKLQGGAKPAGAGEATLLELSVDDVDPERAKRLLSGGLRVLAVADATGSGDVDLYRLRPGSATQVEVWVRSYRIVVTRPEVWLLDRKTGEVLLKKPLDG